MGLIYLVRHGQTACSAADVYCGGVCTAPLNDHGLAMADALASALGDQPLEAIYASPLPRALQMAAPLAARLGRPVGAIPALRELEYGAWEGKSQNELGEGEAVAFARWLTDATDTAPPGGETGRDVATRVADALTTLAARHATGNILLVSHKSALRLALCRLLGIELRYFRQRLAQPLGAVSVIDPLGPGPLLRSLADLSYLPAYLRNIKGS